ncbi:nucleoporin 62 like [Engraulis encrasicolus]|uniref:nucleoporin 62 like n=1 Tax=Engraulis encrasicolus TaxID=184585 RepID=UPI002FD6DDB6
MAFNFGGGGGGGFTFGAPKTTAAPPAAGGGFSFGTPAAQPQAQAPAQTATPQLTSLLTQPTPGNGGAAPMGGGFSFGAPAAQPAPAGGGGFSFGNPAAGGAGLLGTSTPKLGLSLPAASQPAAAPAAGGLGGLMTAASTAGSGFSFGGLATQAPAAAAPAMTAAPPAAQGGFSFGAPKIQATTAAAPAAVAPSLTLGANTGLSLGGAAPAASVAATTAQGGGFAFGIKPAATPAPVATIAPASQAAPPASTGPSLFAAPITSTPATAFTLGGGTTVASLPTASAAPTLGTGLSLKLGTAAPAATAAAPAGIAATTTAAAAAPATGFGLSLKPAASTAPLGTLATAAATTVAAPVSTAPVMTYAQLEGLINKWSSELEDQERHFLQQATQVNAWDRMLVENGERITSLHKDMEKVKLDQRRLDQELDFILSQQKELEDLLGPLEESVKEQSGTIYMQNADEERERTYKLAENVDAQLKRMSQDLKEIIEHLNTSSVPGETTDPLQQICKILNAHMDSLQWVEQNSVLLQRRVEEVSKLCESRSKEQEKNFRLNFQ